MSASSLSTVNSSTFAIPHGSDRIAPHGASARLPWFFMLVLLCGMTFLVPGAARAQSTTEQSVPKGTIRADLQEILREREFQPESPQQSALAKRLAELRSRVETAWNRFVTWLQKLFQGGRAGMGFVGTGLAYALIGILIALGGWALSRVIAAWRQNRPAKPPRAGPVIARHVEPDPDALPAAEWLAAARRHAAAHDFRAAFRAAFLAILMELDRAGTISYARSRTNGDYLGILKSANLRDLYGVLAPLAHDFDLRWYGNRPTTEADYERTLAAYQRLPELTAPRHPAASVTAADPHPTAGRKAD